VAQLFASNDLSDTGVHTLTGSPTFITDQFIKGYVSLDGMDGVNDLCAATSGLVSNSAFSYLMWVNATARSARSAIGTQYGGAAGSNQFQFHFGSTGKLEVFVYGAGGNAVFFTSITTDEFDDEADHYAGFAVDSTSCIIYVDGLAVSLGTQTETGTWVSLGGTTVPLRAGTDHVATLNPGTGIKMGGLYVDDTKMSADDMLAKFVAETANGALRNGLFPPVTPRVIPRAIPKLILPEAKKVIVPGYRFVA